ncbi:MAG: PP2C family protein-serine/threonine phosphatase [Flavobacteriales bacterium]
MPSTKIDKLNENLDLQSFKLHSLLEVTNAINENSSVDRLVKLFEHILRDQLGIEKLLLYDKREEWERLLKVGVEAGEIDVEKELLKFRTITHIESSADPALSEFDVVIPVFHKDLPLAYVLLGGLEREDVASEQENEHLSFIRTLTNIIAVAIENKRLAKENIRQERLKKELELASEMQRHLFPQSLPSNGRLDMAGHYQPHHQVGGDYYDVIRTRDEEFVFCMADVSGKGISAALLMSNFQASLRALVHYTDQSLERMVRDLNEKVMRNSEGEKFITFFIGRVHLGKKRLEYINAGHNPPIMMGKELEPLYLEKGCPGLGMLPELPWVEKGELQMDPDQTVLCYTDGVVELGSEGTETYGYERLVELLKKNQGEGMEALTRSIIEDLDRFRKGAPFSDDIALFAFQTA